MDAQKSRCPQESRAKARGLSRFAGLWREERAEAFWAAGLRAPSGGKERWNPQAESWAVRPKALYFAVCVRQCAWQLWTRQSGGKHRARKALWSPMGLLPVAQLPPGELRVGSPPCPSLERRLPAPAASERFGLPHTQGDGWRANKRGRRRRTRMSSPEGKWRASRKMSPWRASVEFYRSSRLRTTLFRGLRG
jgi:hypothetical protein